MKSHFKNETETQQKLRLSVIGKTVTEANEIFASEPDHCLCVVWEDGKFNQIQKVVNKKRLQVGVQDGIIVEKYQAIDCGVKSIYLMDWH